MFGRGFWRWLWWGGSKPPSGGVCATVSVVPRISATMSVAPTVSATVSVAPTVSATVTVEAC